MRHECNIIFKTDRVMILKCSWLTFFVYIVGPLAIDIIFNH